MDLPNPIPDLYPCAVSAEYQIGTRKLVRHTAFVVQAVSHDEAIGKATKIGEKFYPNSIKRFVQVNAQCWVLEPESAEMNTFDRHTSEVPL